MEKKFDSLMVWLEECKTILKDDCSENEILEKLVKAKNDKILLEKIYSVLEDSKHHQQFLELLCTLFFRLYSTENNDLKLFILSFIPNLIEINFIHSLNPEQKSKFKFIDFILISIYNLALINDDGTIKERSFRIPSLSKPSIYHLFNDCSNLNETEIKKIESSFRVYFKENKVVYSSDYLEKNYLNSSNRMNVYSILIQIFYDSIDLLPKRALEAFCKTSKKLLLYNLNNNVSLKKPVLEISKTSPKDFNKLLNKLSPNLQFSSKFLLQISSCLYFCLFNGFKEESKFCIKRIKDIGLSMMYSDVILMTNAILNSIKNLKETKNQDHFNLNFSLSQNSELITKSGYTKPAITNASFKTHKLSEDIPIIKFEDQEILAVVEEKDENTNLLDKNINQQKIKTDFLTSPSTKNNKDFKKEKRKDKKNRSKIDNQDINMQVINSENRFMYKLNNSKVKPTSLANGEFNYESLKLINEKNDKKNQLNILENEEKIPLV